MTKLDDVTDPTAALALAILKRAKMDAARGDLGALAWLISPGSEWADTLAPGWGTDVINFCRDTWQRMDAGALASRWGL